MEKTTDTQDQQTLENEAVTHDTAANETPGGLTGDRSTQARSQRTVSFEVTVNGDTTTDEVTFSTPQLLSRVNAIDDSATVKIVSKSPDGKHDRILLEGTKAEAVKALTASIIPPERISAHLHNLMNTLIDHSTLKAIAVSATCADKDGNDAGFGFVITSSDCTAGAAVALVNCSDANMDEFITKAKLDVPGRNGPACKGVVTPTAEEVKELG